MRWIKTSDRLPTIDDFSSLDRDNNFIVRSKGCLFIEALDELDRLVQGDEWLEGWNDQRPTKLDLEKQLKSKWIKYDLLTAEVERKEFVVSLTQASQLHEQQLLVMLEIDRLKKQIEAMESGK